MTVLDSFERRYGRYIPENLTYYLLIGQILTYVISYANRQHAGLFPLQGRLLAQGQWWRLLTFAFTPISESLIFVAFAWYFLYLYGVMLEKRWGAFRYLIYLIISYLGSILCAFMFPQQTVTNSYLYISLFLAFAYLYPDMQLLLFFIIPVKVKWLGILTWVGVGSTILFGPLPAKVLAVLSLSNFFLFFGSDLLQLLPKNGHIQRRTASPAEEGVRNICTVCGKYEMDHLDMEFRYCTDCDPPKCYCEQHLENHRHKRTRLIH